MIVSKERPARERRRGAVRSIPVDLNWIRYVALCRLRLRPDGWQWLARRTVKWMVRLRKPSCSSRRLIAYVVPTIVCRRDRNRDS